MHKFMKLAQIMLPFLLLIAGACGPKPEPLYTPTIGPVEPAPALSPKAAWEEDWEATLRAARKEGEVTVYTTFAADWRQAMTEVMEKRYGITFNTLTGRTDEIIARLMREQQNKVYQADVVNAISIQNFLPLIAPKGVLQSLEGMLILPEVVDPKGWWGGKLTWGDPDTNTLLFYREHVSPPLIVNTDLVMPQEMRVWDDLLNPKWKGRMVLNDPTASGAGRTIMTMLAYGIKDWDFVNRFLKQEPAIQRDYRLMTEWAARGKYAIFIGPRKEEAYVFIKEGAPLKFVNFQDGSITTRGAGSVAVPNGSPHPNAAKVFINYFLTKEGQTITAKTGGYPSLRVDVPTDFLEPETLRQPGTRYFGTDDMDYLQKLPEIERKMAQFIAPLMK